MLKLRWGSSNYHLQGNIQTFPKRVYVSTLERKGVFQASNAKRK
jgi:hypothetical protein